MDFVGMDKMSLVDFDDYIAITLFTEGCNFKCPFCHNGSLVLHKNNPIIPWKVIRDLLIERRKMVDAVVISGGEPLIHPDIVEKMKEIKELGYLIKLDTNGTNPDLLIRLIEDKLIDYVAIDIKNSPKKYNLTSGSNLSLDNLNKTINYLKLNNVAYEFRTTVIKEFHSLNDLLDIANWVKECPKYVLQHYKDREECIAHGFHEIDENTIKLYQKEISKIIPNTLLRGY